MSLHTYFVSFRTDDGQYGNAMLIFDSKIKTTDHINQLQAHLLEVTGKPCIVLHFQQVAYEKVKKVEAEPKTDGEPKDNE